MSDIDRQIQSRVEGFVAELSTLVRKAALAAVESALTGGGASTSRAPAAARAAHAPTPALAKGRPGRRPAGKAAAPKAAVRHARKPGEKRSKDELDKLTEKLAEHIRANKGQGVEAIARAIGSNTKELSLPIKKLLATKRITSQGHKRATRYFPK
ncbi:MAG TPA: DNA-binding protein [Byssovorax sp.]|jgi:hypothetical protein